MASTLGVQRDERDDSEVSYGVDQNRSKSKELHACRMQLLKVRKTSTHSDFLQQLEKMMEVSEWSSISQYKFLCPFFAEQADSTMSRAAMEILFGPDPGPSSGNPANKDCRD